MLTTIDVCGVENVREDRENPSLGEVRETHLEEEGVVLRSVGAASDRCAQNGTLLISFLTIFNPRNGTAVESSTFPAVDASCETA